VAVALAVAAASLFVHADDARAASVADAAGRARLIAQTKLAPMLAESDLDSPVGSQRYKTLETAVKRTILKRSDVEQVTIWSDVGRVLFAQDDKLIGTKPTYIRNFVYGVANGTTQTQVESGTLKTFTPIWRQPGGTVVVAELDQPFGPLAGTAGRVFMPAALVLGLGSLVCWVLFAMTWRSGGGGAARSSLVQPAAAPGRVGPAPTPTGAQALGPVMAAAPPSVVKRVSSANAEAAKPDPGLREVEQARSDAEQRARAAEDRLTRLQLQHKQAMERLQALEARLSVAAAAPKQSQEELRALRDQVRESAERLHSAEAENEQLRARLEAPHLPGVGAGGNQR